MEFPKSTLETIQDSLQYYNGVDFKAIIVYRDNALVGSLDMTTNNVLGESECNALMELIPQRPDSVTKVKFDHTWYIFINRNGYTTILKL